MSRGGLLCCKLGSYVGRSTSERRSRLHLMYCLSDSLVNCLRDCEPALARVLGCSLLIRLSENCMQAIVGGECIVLSK